jgi:DNA-binding CsgD family transcriptional regulator
MYVLDNKITFSSREVFLRFCTLGYMKWFSIFCILLLFSTFCCLADTPLNSLKKRLSTYHLSDTTGVNLLSQLGCQYLITDPLLFEWYDNKVLSLSDSLNYTKGKAFAGRAVGVSHRVRGHYAALKEIQVARNNYKPALAYQEELTARKDSQYEDEKSRQMAQMQVRYQTLQQEQELQLQQKQLEILQQKNLIHQYLRNGLITGLLLLIVIAYLGVSKQRLKIRKNKELLEKNKALAEAELEKARLQELILTQQLEFKNKELTSYMLNLIRKNEVLEELRQNMQQLKVTQDKATASKLNDLNRMVEHSMNLDKDWEDFKRHFEELHKDFFKSLKDNYPDITSHELKLCALLKLNMNLKEASHVMGISPESVKTARYRLRKKFNLTRDENLIDYILELEKKGDRRPADSRKGTNNNTSQIR